MLLSTASPQRSTAPKVLAHVARVCGISDDDAPTHLQSLMSSGTPSFTSFIDESSSADALMSAIDQHPVSVAIEADQSAFYSSSIHSKGCGTNGHHGALDVCCDIAEDYYPDSVLGGTTYTPTKVDELVLNYARMYARAVNYR